MRNALAVEQGELYVQTITNINMRYRELLKNDFGITLLKNCAWDIADTLANRYFNTAGFYISPQQVVDRIINFSYEQRADLSVSNASIRKLLYENANNTETLRSIMLDSEKAGAYLFTVDRKKDPLEAKTKDYRLQREAAGDMKDDITGKEESYYKRVKNGKEESVSTLHADHKQARDNAKYNSQYIHKDRLDDMREFYYSNDNLWLIDASANSSKGAVRICKVDGQVVIMSDKEFKSALDKNIISEKADITWKASAEELANATIAMWEKETASGKKIANLQEKGYLDENGKVRPGVKEAVVEAYKKSMNAESRKMILPYYEEKDGKKTLKMPWLDYAEVTEDAVAYTKKAFKKIVIGQVIYYVLPPCVFEAKTLLQKKNMTLERFFKEIKKSGNRVVQYVTIHLGEIFKNIAGNSIHKFIKTLFDIIIEAVKGTVKRILKTVKQFVLSLVSCVKIIFSKNATPSQKADAVTKTMSVTISSVVLEVLFEWLEIEFELPDTLMEPLQIIVTILVSNLIMLILQKADLFDVRYGFLVSNIHAIFEQENQAYLEESNRLKQQGEREAEAYMDELHEQISDIENNLADFDPFEDDACMELDKLNEIYQMGIDFKKEWIDFCQSGLVVGGN